ncbi:MAG: zinc-dependent alcohol dehydrogenase family protein, partial [Anaerolineae bacterium]
MRAVLFPGDREVVHIEAPTPTPEPGEVVVRVKASGLCGSELHSLYQVSKERKQRSSFADIIPGHEPAGIVESVGPCVDNVQPGDRVTVYHIAGCGYYRYCQAGWMINCSTNKRSYGWDANGGHAEFILVDARNCVPLPEPLTFADGAHCACGGGTAYQALSRLQVSGRDRLAIFGVGPVGLGALMLAKAMGATVYAVDLVDERVALAADLGADVAINADEEDPVAVIRELTGGEGVETAMDCSADPVARNNTLDCARIWGRVVWVGEGHATTINPSPQMLHKQLTVMGTWVCGLTQLEELVRFMVHHDVSFERMVTHRFPLSQIEKG